MRKGAIMLSLLLGLVISVHGQRTLPIERGYLTTDLNGNGYSITNLASVQIGSFTLDSPYFQQLESRLNQVNPGVTNLVAASTNGIPALVAASTNGIPAMIAAAMNAIPLGPVVALLSTNGSEFVTLEPGGALTQWAVMQTNVWHVDMPYRDEALAFGPTNFLSDAPIPLTPGVYLGIVLNDGVLPELSGASASPLPVDAWGTGGVMPDVTEFVIAGESWVDISWTVTEWMSTNYVATYATLAELTNRVTHAEFLAVSNVLAQAAADAVQAAGEASGAVSNHANATGDVHPQYLLETNGYTLAAGTVVSNMAHAAQEAATGAQETATGASQTAWEAWDDLFADGQPGFTAHLTDATAHAGIARFIGSVTNSAGYTTNMFFVTAGGVTNSLPFDRAGGGCGIPKTGWTNSYDVGDDGYYQAGVALPSPLWEIVGAEGTAETNQVRHIPSGLVFARDVDGLIPATNYVAALALVEALEYGGATDWRMPNYNEIDTAVDRSKYQPVMSGLLGTNLWTSGNPWWFSRYNQNVNFWTSTPDAAPPTTGKWAMGLRYGLPVRTSTAPAYYTWPVRGGTL